MFGSAMCTVFDDIEVLVGRLFKRSTRAPAAAPAAQPHLMPVAPVLVPALAVVEDSAAE